MTQKPTEIQQHHAELVTTEPQDEIAQLTHPKKRRFLEVFYATNGNVSKSCAAIKIGRRTYYEWIAKDKQFCALVQEQLQQLLDEADSRLKQEALTGKDKNHLTALIFLLKSRHPEYKPQKETVAYEDQAKGVRFVLTRGK